MPSFSNPADPGQKKRLIVVAAGLLIFAVVAVLFFALMFGGQQSNRQILLPVAGTQADIIAITDEGQKNLRSSELLNNSTTIGLVVQTHNNTINPYIGEKATDAAKAYQNTQYQTEFQDSLSNGTFDSTFETVLAQKLDLYKQQLVSAYSEIESPTVKKEIADLHNQAKQLSGEE